MITQKLCRPCAEAIKAKQGDKVSLMSLGVDIKITCEVCGRRRYGWTLSTRKEKKRGAD